MTWRKIADRVLRDEGSGTIGPIGTKGGESAANVPNVPIVPASPERLLRQWQVGLAKVDPHRLGSGFAPAAWQTLCDDAAWLLDAFGVQAAREGWSSADLFGLWPDKSGWGGVADRLGGSRQVMFAGDRVSWRRWGVTETYARGCYPDLRPFWEASDDDS